MKLERAAAQLEALGNPTRLKIYRVLVRAGAEGLPVGRIQEKLAIPGSTLSHHCKRLIETGLVTQERQATTLICRARYPAMQSLIGYLRSEEHTSELQSLMRISYAVFCLKKKNNT